ncbi:hypothetical protein [Streptomyces scabiei]|uniref:hypothetical protein n=1 Tax=Streptomyces scabiei TaxID=1930 RepID=UPI0029AE87FE|nr:hypothetical protein [Streptomyces scabiei]MDX3206076.1 hypothetical protein [Streptomyces scabiei]
MNEFISKHAVRIVGIAAAAVPLAAFLFPDIPWEGLVATAAALFGVSEVAQRHENTKTAAALAAPSPWDRAAAAQKALEVIAAEKAADVSADQASTPAQY